MKSFVRESRSLTKTLRTKLFEKVPTLEALHASRYLFFWRDEYELEVVASAGGGWLDALFGYALRWRFTRRSRCVRC